MASTRARIAIDAMGGDDAPAAIVAGAIQAQTELADVDVILVGDPEQIQACLDRHPQRTQTRDRASRRGDRNA